MTTPPPPPGSYQAKLAELRATAEGGMSGRQAYKEGRQRLISDQRAAIDAALAGPVRMGSGTAAALDKIIAPVGNAGAARIDFAGARHGESMDSLDTALKGALGQLGKARDLNYTDTLGQSRLATDRNTTLARMQRDAAEREARERAAVDSYNQSERKAAAEALGGMAHDQATTDLAAYQTPEFKRELSRISGTAFAHIQDPKERQALLKQVLDAGTAGDMDTVMGLVDQYAPRSRGLFSSLAGAVGGLANRIREGSGLAPNVTPVQQRSADIARILDDVAALQDLQGQRSRQLDADRYLYNQDAYTALFGDPLLAAGIFPRALPEQMLEANDDITSYINTGMYGSQYDKWLAEQNKVGERGVKFDIATGASTSPGVVDRAAKNFGLDEADLYANLEPGTAGHEVVKATIQSAAARLDEGEDFKAVQAAAVTATRADAKARGLDNAYADALARIVSEQLKVYAQG